MIGPNIENVINELNKTLVRLHPSAAQYILETEPYLTKNDKDAMGVVAEIANSDIEHIKQLTLLIESIDGIPQTGAPAPYLSDLNYLSFPFLLDTLIRIEQSELILSEKRVENTKDHPEGNALLTKILDLKKDHIKKMQDIRQRRYKSDEPEEEPAAASATD